MAFWTLIGLAKGKATTGWPEHGDDGQKGLLGMPRYNPDLCAEGCDACAATCPTKALTARPGGGLNVDYGRCVVCQLCTGVCPTGAMSPSSDWAFGARRREDLRWADAAVAAAPTSAPELAGFRRSLHIRHVDAGSCNGCESNCRR